MQTFPEYLKSNYPQYDFLLQKVASIIGEQPDWQHFTKTNLIQIRKGLLAEHSANSTRTYLAVLKAIFGQVSEEGVLSCNDYESVLIVRKEASTAVYLTEQELERLMRVKTKSDAERYVLCVYGIQSYTGCRVSDAEKLSQSNIQGSRLSYVSIKTKTEATVPLKPIVAELIEQLQTLKPVSNVTYCNIIKILCCRAGINEEVRVFKGGKDVTEPKCLLVSTHTARRSFATNLYLRKPDLYLISKYMGHSTSTMTEKYICCGIRELNDNFKTYFE